ncbi:hypothetical protein BpHYR1_019213 [Brachionus plicatilis]|uniref:Uncharacterized protein n=1 Tax=Brachionus plicatilis TaxID=10195 RepID=A0A3M7RE59_BRAPC|nr:hypothetical protein BpHYR1_019213 [Brachionus plicatilis]
MITRSEARYSLKEYGIAKVILVEWGLDILNLFITKYRYNELIKKPSSTYITKNPAEQDSDIEIEDQQDSNKQVIRSKEAID